MNNREEMLDDIRERAKQANKLGHEAEVVELLHAYLPHRPGDGYMWYLFGDALRIIGLMEEAERALSTALDLEPEKRAQILTRIARLHNSAGRYIEAERCFAEACLDTEFGAYGWLWIMRGANLASATHLSAAEECHRHAITCDESHFDRDEAYLNLGYVLRAQGRYAEAAAAFQAALTLTPDYPEAATALSSLTGIEEAISKVKQLFADFEKS